MWPTACTEQPAAACIYVGCREYMTLMPMQTNRRRREDDRWKKGGPELQHEGVGQERWTKLQPPFLPSFNSYRWTDPDHVAQLYMSTQYFSPCFFNLVKCMCLLFPRMSTGKYKYTSEYWQNNIAKILFVLYVIHMSPTVDLSCLYIHR